MTFFIHVRYWGAFVIICIGMFLCMPGGALVRLGRWIGSRDRKPGEPALFDYLAQERERCAKLCEEVVTHPAGHRGQWEGYGPIKATRDGHQCAAAIRALK